MQLEWIDWAVIALFIAVLLWLGLRYTKEAGQSVESFFLGGRQLPWWIAGTSMVATTFAADTPLLVTELVAKNGISGNWLWWNALIGGMLTTFFFAKLWRRAGIVTDLELIELRFSGKQAGVLRGFKAIYLGVFLNAVVIAWVNLALMSLLEIFFGISKEEQLLYAGLAMLLVAGYSSLSGLMGVAITDFLQFMVAMSGCIVLAFIVLDADAVGGVAGLQEKLPQAALQFFPNVGEASGAQELQAFGIGLSAFLAFVGFQWWASWYPGAEPGGGGYVAQRMMSAKTEGDAIKATLLFQVAHYALRPWPWILVGLATIVLYPDLAADQKRLGYVMAMRDFLPAGLRGLLLAAFFAAYMSTISTQLNWGASYLINDFYKRFISPQADEKGLVRASRLGTFVMMLAGLGITSVMGTMEGAFNFMISCGAGLGMVLILRWYWWRINAWSEIAATIAPFIAMGALHFKPEWGEYHFFITICFVTATWLAVTFLTRPTDMATLEAFYKRVKPLGAWQPVAASLGVAHSNRSLPQLFALWAAGIALGYSALFCIGKVIFADWLWAGIYFGIASSSWLFLSKKLN